MAILIPSKHIYGDIENPKVRNNLITKVEVQQKVVTPDNDYETAVYNERADIVDAKKSAEHENKDLQREYRTIAGGGTTSVHILYAFVSYDQQSVYDITVNVPVIKDNHWIKDLKKGKSYNEITGKQENNIKVSLFGTIKQGTVSATVNPSNDTIANLVFTETEESNPQSYNFPESLTITHPAFALSVTANTSLIDVGNVGTALYEIVTIDGKDFYQFNLRIMCDCRTIEMAGATSGVSSSVPDAVLSGTYKVYSATQIEITFYGNTIGIDLADGTVTYGSGNNPYTINGSELVQNNSSFAQSMANKIISEYSKGKETATLRCDIGEYYLYNEDNPQVEGEKKISASDESLSMTFTEGDIVIPMMPSARGGDEPMSRYQDGKPKQFRVIGTSIMNDGAVWQKIYLQEV